jgi:hypothetical protein
MCVLCVLRASYPYLAKELLYLMCVCASCASIKQALQGFFRVGEVLRLANSS